MAKIVATFLLALIYSISNVQSQSQSVVLYENTGSTGSFVNFGASYVPDLSTYSFNNRARSTCVTGVWLFYDIVSYNLNTNAGMEFVFGNNYCVNFVGLGGAVSSIRFAGSPSDYRTSTLTLYVGTYFQGSEEYTVSDLPSLSLGGRITSFIITGSPSEAYTLYTLPNYAGDAVCVYPPSGSIFEPAFIYDTTIVSIQHNTIRSVRKGCFGKVAPVKSTRQGYQRISEADEIKAE